MGGLKSKRAGSEKDGWTARTSIVFAGRWESGASDC